MQLTPDNLTLTLREKRKTAECIWWPEKQFNLIRDFALANGFYPEKNSFSYMRIKHFKLSRDNP